MELEIVTSDEASVLETYVVDGNLPAPKLAATIDTLLKDHPAGCKWRWKQYQPQKLSNSEINEFCQQEIFGVVDQQTQMNLVAHHPTMDNKTSDTYLELLEWIDSMISKAREYKSSTEPVYSVEWPEPSAAIRELAARY